MVRVRRVPSRRRAAKNSVSPRAIPSTPLRASSTSERGAICHGITMASGSSRATASRFLSRFSRAAEREVGSRRHSRLEKAQQKAAARAAATGAAAAGAADRGPREGGGVAIIA